LESDVNINLDFLDDKDESLPKDKSNLEIEKSGNLQKNNQKVSSSLFNSDIHVKNSSTPLMTNSDFSNLLPNNLQFANKRTFINTNLTTQNNNQSNIYNVGQSKI
jgi:hypothetical protein